MKQAQGDRVIEALKRKALTYGEMLDLRVCPCPWKRALERIRAHPGWRITRELRYMGDGKYLTTWRVKRAA